MGVGLMYFDTVSPHIDAVQVLKRIISAFPLASSVSAKVFCMLERSVGNCSASSGFLLVETCNSFHIHDLDLPPPPHTQMGISRGGHLRTPCSYSHR